jgi:phosphoribosylaminoimidazolecarboxamide formyltransferase/IMP cyclohydrolase
MSATRRALLSVSDKRGLVDFARALEAAGFELISTGGTFKALREAGVTVKYVTEATGFPEVFDGRVKTLHPVVHGGILHRRDLPAHVEQAASLDIAPIDVVAVNLYPFRETVAKPGVTYDDAIENIDIGGPAMVRASAKNHAHVTIVVSPDDYPAVAREIAENGATSLETRKRLALAAYRHTSAYDAAISTWLATALGEDKVTPAEIHTPLVRIEALRYGENPHQRAALYREAGAPPLAGSRVLQGKALSYSNIIDLDAAVGAVLEFDEPAAVVVKHTNPCGVGRHTSDVLSAWRNALAGDPVSVFGGIVAVNRPVDAALATELAAIFLEIIVAPRFTPEAVEVLAKKTALRLVETEGASLAPARVYRHTAFGMLVQDADAKIAALNEPWKVVTRREPTEQEREALSFLWRVCKHVKSNAIVVGGAERTYGVGAGQMSRVDSVELAVKKATASLEGACLASDAFFPFRDGLDAAAAAGVKAIIQPGGSRRDDEVIAAADEHGIAMVFTDHRHFRH